MNWLKPTKANILGTGLVYVALILSSVWDFLLFSSLFSAELLQAVESAKSAIDTPSRPFLTGFAVLVLSPAMQLFLIYVAVSYSIYLTKSKYRGGN